MGVPPFVRENSSQREPLTPVQKRRTTSSLRRRGAATGTAAGTRSTAIAMAPSTPSPAPSKGGSKGILTASSSASTSLANVNPVDHAANAGPPHGDGAVSAGTPGGSGAANAASPGGAGSSAFVKPLSGVSPGNTVQLHQLVTGCRVFVDRSSLGEEMRKAEILSIRMKKMPRVPRGEEQPKPQTEYYVHYVEFNKRLDEWVASSRLLMSQPVEWPSAPATSGHGHGHAASPTPANKAPLSKRPDQGLRKTAIKRAASKAGEPKLTKAQLKKRKLNKDKAGSATPAGTPTGTTEDEDKSLMDIDSPTTTRSPSANPERESSTDPATPRDLGTPEQDEDENDENDEANASGAVVAVELVDDNDDVDDDADPADAAAPNVLEKESHFSKEQEIESLRTHGSMTQSVHEVSRVKNLDKIQMGAAEVEAWYFSPYPVEYAHIPVLYICEFCLSFYGSPKMLARHRHKCALFHPPGNEIYRHEEISFYEIDGKKQKTWCRNLCLLSKAFLDHKTLYYDVDPFLYYVMCARDETGVHLVGYFSKEKESAEGYNLACILTLPQFQRKGYGRLLIQFSYELSSIEGKLGSPEKPLSDLGLLSYRQYWTENLVEALIEANETDSKVSIDMLANNLSMTSQDVESTLQALQMQVYHKGEHKIILPMHLIKKHEAMKEKQKTKPKRVIDPSLIQWKPPVFTASSRTWGW